MSRRGKKGPWHYIGAAGEPSYVNSYTSYGGGYLGARYRKDADGLVTVAGLIANAFTFAGASGIFQLPAAFCPSGFGVGTSGYLYSQVAFIGGLTQQRVDIFQDGTVILQQATAAAITYMSLDGMSFYTDF